MQNATFRRQLIRLALKGRGRVSPNPLVGALVVKNGQIISKGYHAYFGGPHAEVMALEKAGEEAKGAALYVSLEPCNYFGKTPPCVDLIIKSGISSVWVGMTDPNPLVAGQGIARLREAGLTVEAAEDREFINLNRYFVKYITQKLPWVALKNALTLDGRINNKQAYLSSKESLKLVHRWRDYYDAIGIGINTLLADNPALNVRLIKAKGKLPYRIIFDSQGRTPSNAKIFSEIGGEIVIITTSLASEEKLRELRGKGADIILAPLKNGRVDLREALKKLVSEKNIASLLLEGGTTLNSAFLQEKLADEVSFFFTPQLWGKEKGQAVIGNLASIVKLKNLKSHKVGLDILITGEIEY